MPTYESKVWLSGQFHRPTIYCLNYLHNIPCSPLPSPPAHDCLASVCTSPVMGNSLFHHADGFKQQTLISLVFQGLSPVKWGTADKGPYTIKLRCLIHRPHALPKSPVKVFQRTHMHPSWAREMGSVSRVPKMRAGNQPLVVARIIFSEVE